MSSYTWASSDRAAMKANCLYSCELPCTIFCTMKITFSFVKIVFEMLLMLLIILSVMITTSVIIVELNRGVMMFLRGSSCTVYNVPNAKDTVCKA